MKCKNEKCSFRKNGLCTVFQDKDHDMAAEEFIENDICGWVDKLEL
jgi:hypothetical protein